MLAEPELGPAQPQLVINHPCHLVMSWLQVRITFCAAGLRCRVVRARGITARVGSPAATLQNSKINKGHN